jgi:hypothetical protein
VPTLTSTICGNPCLSRVQRTRFEVTASHDSQNGLEAWQERRRGACEHLRQTEIAQRLTHARRVHELRGSGEEKHRSQEKADGQQRHIRDAQHAR